MSAPNPESLRVAMLAIKALDPQASIELSEYTQQWFVHADIDVSDGMVLTGPTEHRDTPDEAVLAYHERLRSITLDERIAARPLGERRHYRWNGAAFAEVPGFRQPAQNDGSGGAA